MIDKEGKFSAIQNRFFILKIMGPVLTDKPFQKTLNRIFIKEQ
ncbi:MAG: hypothetical protein M0T82_07240 [Desulfobacteraceae bacterium]|nr:hypothetical protein [Desulfobacteraceae bacterium]